MRSDRARYNSPLKSLGSRLKFVRENAKETLAEVSGAVEIDMDLMQNIESGSQLPSEEILLLLISHFDINDDEAASLWELAGYTDDDDTSQNSVLTPENLKIVYSDMTHITSNKYGVVMNFMQSTGGGNQPMLISRVGMSREQAHHIMETLELQLNQPKLKSTPKSLPSPKTSKKQRSSK